MYITYASPCATLFAVSSTKGTPQMDGFTVTCLFSLSKTTRKVLAWVALSKFIWRLIKIWTVQSCNIRSYINSLQVRPHFLVLHSVCFNEELQCQHKPWMADGYMVGCFVTRSGPMGRKWHQNCPQDYHTAFCILLSLSVNLPWTLSFWSLSIKTTPIDSYLLHPGDQSIHRLPLASYIYV